MRQRPHALVPRLLLPLTLLAAVCVTGCSDPSPTTDRELSGYVIDETTRAPVSGATVTFTSDTRYTSATTTDADGLYEMIVQTDSAFGQIKVEKAAYFTAEMTVLFDTDRRRVDFTLREAAADP